MSGGGVRFRIKGTDRYVEPLTPASLSVPGPFDAGATAPPYNAAATGGNRGRSWRSSAVGPNAALSYNRETLVNRSRDAARQNPSADAALGIYETNIIATGIKPVWQTPDAGLNKALRELWEEWNLEADADGRLSFYGLQSLSARSTAEGGECFIKLLTRSPAEMDSVPLQLQVLESEFVPMDDYVAAPRPGEYVINGVIFNAEGRRVSYMMYTQHPNDYQAYGAQFNAIPVRVPANQVIQQARIRRPGEVRGEPWLTRGLITMRDAHGYNDAQLVRQQVSSLIAGFITTTATGDLTEVDNDEEGLQKAAVGWEPGTMQRLEPGEEVTFSGPQEVSSSYESFMRHQTRQVAVSAGVMYEQISGDYSQLNDRTFRASVNEFRRQVTAWQHNVFIFQTCRPVLNSFIDLGIVAGRIETSARVTLRDLRRVTWQPRGWDYIHPLQEAQANTLLMRTGQTSRSEIVAQRGKTAEEIDEQQAEDNARADELGLAYESDGRVSRAGGGAVNDPGEDDDDDGDSRNKKKAAANA